MVTRILPRGTASWNDSLYFNTVVVAKLLTVICPVIVEAKDARRWLCAYAYDLDLSDVDRVFTCDNRVGIYVSRIPHFFHMEGLIKQNVIVYQLLCGKLPTEQHVAILTRDRYSIYVIK